MDAKVDMRVSYEDMANPRREGTIVQRVGDEFRICWDDGTWSISDCRQSGWREVTMPSFPTWSGGPCVVEHLVVGREAFDRNRVRSERSDGLVQWQVTLRRLDGKKSWQLVEGDPPPQTIRRHGMEGMSYVGHPGPVRTYRLTEEKDERGRPIYQEIAEGEST